MRAVFEPPYRAAVIGRTGRGDYGHGLDAAFRDHPKLKLVGLADPDDAGRAAAAKRLGVEATHADYRAMLDAEKPQFVAVCPRWIDDHRAMVVACAERGIHVFCEKPLAPTLADCDAMIEACAKSHVKLAIAFQTRYGPRFDRVKELIASGAIGEVLELRGRGKEDRRGGGEDLFVLGTHIVDMMRGLLGDPAWCVANVTEGGRSVGKAEVRQGNEGLGLLAGDRIDAMYGFRDSPAVAHFATSRPKEPGRRFGLEVLGSKGRISLGTGALPPTFVLNDPAWTGVSNQGRWVEISSAGVGQPEPLNWKGFEEVNRLIVDDLIRAVETDVQPKASLADGVAAVEMVLACYASHVAGGRVTLPLDDRAHHPLELLRNR